MDGIEDFLREPAFGKLEAIRKSSLLEIGEKIVKARGKARRQIHITYAEKNRPKREKIFRG